MYRSFVYYTFNGKRIKEFPLLTLDFSEVYMILKCVGCNAGMQLVVVGMQYKVMKSVTSFVYMTVSVVCPTGAPHHIYFTNGLCKSSL